MRITLLLLTCSIFPLFGGHTRSTPRAKITLNIPEGTRMVSEIKEATDADDDVISVKRQTYVPHWLKRRSAIRIDSNGVLYYPPECAWMWPDNKDKKECFGDSVSPADPAAVDVNTNRLAPSSVSRPVNPHDDNNNNKHDYRERGEAKKRAETFARNNAAIQSTTATTNGDKSRFRPTDKTISEAKCKEYADGISKTIEVLPLVGLTPQVVKIRNRMVCETENPLVTGGAKAAPGVHSHVAALGRHADDGTFVFHCAGSLIAHTWVLTAAHCTYGPNGSPTVVRLGVYSLKNERSGVTVAIGRMIRHPDYKPPAMYADVALLQLRRAVAFNQLVKPACLHQEYDRSPSQAWVSGWGSSDFAGELSDELRHARLDIVDNLSCAMHYKTAITIPNGISPSMICAGDPNGGWRRDTCLGDSGGPLQIIRSGKSCLFRIVGVTSFGEACATENSPGVYIRVSHYLPWIEGIVWSNETR